MRKEYFDLLIDGQPILTPDEDLEMEYSDLDSAESGRDEAGVMHRIVLRTGVRKLTLRYGQLTREEYRYMTALFAGKREFTVTCRDHDGFPTAFRAYHSNHGITVRNARTGLYRNYQISIIEC